MSEPDPHNMRIPKGILKNKYGSNNSNNVPSRERDNSDQVAMQAPYNYSRGGSSGSGSWDPQLGMSVGPVPVPAPQHGMNMPNPVLDPIIRGIRSELSPQSQKLHEFINSKHDLLFRPLDPDEMPLSEVKGVQRNNEDHYGIVPSLDHFLRIDSNDLKRYFFQNVAVGDIVIGKIVSRSNSGIYMRLICTENGRHMILEDLNVRAFCPTHQTIPVLDPKDPSRYYDIDDFIRVEVIESNADSERLITGMKGITLNPELQHAFQLGFLSRHDLPPYYLVAKKKSNQDPRTRRSFEEMLLQSPGFQNPNSISNLASSMGIYSNSNSLLKGLRTEFPQKEMASYLRRMQNAKWAHGHVAEGIRLFKDKKFKEAEQCLKTALTIDPGNVEGLTARGGLNAHNGCYEKAIDDFEAALKFNPNHFNAGKYLAETLVALGRQQESQGKLEDAIASYSKSLVIRADHKEAKEALWSLHARTEKLDPAKMTGPAAAKAAELKAKLKTILQSELGLKVDSKGTKEKKSKKDKKKKDSSASDDDSSSSSSSDESSSESSSSGSGYKKKKKRKKKKSKKSKKSRRESGGDKKTRELSLSPFSKRLADPHGVAAGSSFSGFTDSTYAELQLGIPKHDKEDSEKSDTESKRSSRKSKEKKRSKKSKEKKKKKKHVSSDSSSSDSEHDRSKKKSKKVVLEEAPLKGLGLADLGDLEAKLSAYYTKVEQGKIEAKAPERRSRSRSRSRGREREKEREHRDRNREREPGVRDMSPSPVPRKRPKEFYDDIPPRIVENVQAPKPAEPDRMPEIPWSERMHGKIDLQTDEYGNIVQHEAIVRTVKNDPPAEQPKPGKFEMKFKPMTSVGSVEAENGAAGIPSSSTVADTTSKWRPLGVAAPQSEAMKNAFERESSEHSIDDNRKDKSSAGDDKNYRRRSYSRSPGRRRRRSRSFSRSRSRSRSRSQSRSRSRSRSPYRRDRRPFRRDAGYRGRAPVRFFRGYNYQRGRRPYNPRPYNSGGRDREHGGGGRSKFRNRFSHTPSRSRSRSKSRSRSRSMSPRDRRRDGDRSRDRIRGSPPLSRDEASVKSFSQSQESTNKVEADSVSQSEEGVKTSPGNSAEIEIRGLKTSSTADVELLLDKRNAEKKEEMRKSNPDFFRAT